MTGLREAVQIGDPEAFGRAVHTLRGMLRGVRATAAEQLAASLQSLDPQQQKEQARATCELLEQAVSSFRARLVSLAGQRSPMDRTRSRWRPANAARAVTYPEPNPLQDRMGHKNHLRM